MISAIKALSGSVAGVVTLGLGYTVASHELHYWMQPAHLPVALTVAAALSAAGVGGTATWATKAIQRKREHNELRELRERLLAKDTLPEAPAQPQQWSPRADKQVIDMTAPANAQRITRL